MKKSLFLIFLLPVSILVRAQFEQKASINFAIGTFKTFGYELGEYDYDPLQMPHYRPGITADGGFQFNISRHFSLMAGIGIMYSGKWSYKMGDYDYLHYTIYDTIPDPYVLLAEGKNKLNLFNFDVGIYPKYYLFAVKKWNPYIFAGVSINFTSAKYTDNCWSDAKANNYLPPDDTGPYSPWLEKNTGIGFIPGIGIEHGSGGRITLDFSAGWNHIGLKEVNFKSQYVTENFNAFFLHAGLRLNFFMTKDL